MKSSAMKHVIAGTAGHIDHGKTALVRALTGTDTDRLKEEKQRGISIDLGFAHLDLSNNLRIGFVDVPGHERFIKNMLAGVGGIDLVLFVIAADESIKPQTREHFDICRLLHIPRGMVVLTKSDLVDQDILELVRLEVDEFVRGSFLESAPVIPVSSVKGTGLDELRDELARLAGEVHEKDASRHFRLPIDRAFSMRGFGTVVTGTLISGHVKPEQEVELFPARRRLRVRGVQTHGATVPRASAGQRTAVNLSGIEPAELARGMTLAEAGRFAATQQIDCVFDLLPSAKPLKNRAPVHLHIGSAEAGATIRPLGSTQPLSPGSRSYVRLALKEPLQILPGDRFIVRMFSPVITIGGGTVLDISPPRRSSADRMRVLED
ncbi:MAG: selenocysteine-specific translation elongation factor, partial [Acidobacteriaceae bacterium]|nr:selenocysteine-specific translation elongation factor [Acidobacteriaceae bacterium]